MRTVYLLRSVTDPARRHVGSTDDLRRCLTDHNAGRAIATAGFRPWRVVVAVVFQDDDRAVAFEHYLDSGTGAEFARRHFW
jgi:predicted GIY-YIG superfamily endonuclease